MKLILVSLAAAVLGVAVLLVLPGDMEFGVVLCVVAIFLARAAWRAGEKREAADARHAEARLTAPSTLSEEASFESLTGKYARLLRELAAAHADCPGDPARSGQIARLTEELAAVHWAVAEARAPALPAIDALSPSSAAHSRRHWVHRSFARLREHEPAMPTRDAIDIARAFYAHSRWRSAPPEVAVDLEMLELELRSDRGPVLLQRR